MKLIMLTPFTFLLLPPKPLSQHSITEHCQPVFIAYCDTPSSTTTDKITLLCIITFIFGDSKLEHNRFWTELWQGYPTFILLMISLCMQF